jgi:hypothetical protein
MVREDDAVTCVDLQADRMERRVGWPRDLGRALAFSADGGCVLTLAPTGVRVMNWTLAEELRSYEARTDPLAQARWLSAAGLSQVLDSYPSAPEGSATCLADAYGAWACGDRQTAQQVFTHTPSLTRGTIALLTRAVNTAPQK